MHVGCYGNFRILTKQLPYQISGGFLLHPRYVEWSSQGPGPLSSLLWAWNLYLLLYGRDNKSFSKGI